MESVPFIVTSTTLSTSSFTVLDHNEVPIYNVSLNAINDVEQICKDANQGFKNWSTLELARRIMVLNQFKTNFTLLEQQLKLECLRIGIPHWFTNFNYSLATDMIDDAIHNISTLDEGTVPTSYKQDQLSLVLRQPVGPVLCMSPWNAPIILTMRSILAPLLAGCSVLVKSSELSSKISYLICDAFVNSGGPDGVLQLIHTTPNDVAQFVKRVIANDNIQMVNFTGSTAVGKKIATICGEYLKPCLLELGGKNSTIIIDDVADLDHALEACVWSSWAHKGQICMCNDRLYIQESIYEKSLSALIKVADKLANEDEDQLINQRNQLQSNKINALVDDALSKNAKLLYKSSTTINDDNFIPPMILTNITNDMEISRAEIFGPILTVSKFTSVETLVEELNDEPHGLKTSIWSSNHLRLIQMLKLIQSGGVHINSSTINDEVWLPHGGMKNSGNGRFNGKWGIESFTNIKTITLNS